MITGKDDLYERKVESSNTISEIIEKVSSKQKMTHPQNKTIVVVVQLYLGPGGESSDHLSTSQTQIIPFISRRRSNKNTHLCNSDPEIKKIQG